MGLLAPSAALAFVPKCPLCLLAYAGALGASGAVLPIYQRFALPLTAASLALLVLALLAARQRAPAGLALVAGALVLLAGLGVADRSLLPLGVALLFLAAAWGAARRPVVPTGDRSAPTGGAAQLSELRFQLRPDPRGQPDRSDRPAPHPCHPSQQPITGGIT